MTKAKAPKIRLLTYNIHGCIGRGGHYDARAILEVLRRSNADIIALQEVYDEEPEDRRFLKMLQQSDYHVQYGRTLQHESRGDYGNILLSRWPLANVELLDISVAGTEPRGAIFAEVAHPSTSLQVIATHFGLSSAERYQQAQDILEHHQRVRRHHDASIPFALMGDLNEWRPRGKPLRLLESILGKTPALRTFPASAPLFALDRIWVSPRKIHVSQRTLNFPLARRASDHLPVIADIEPNARTRRPVL